MPQALKRRLRAIDETVALDLSRRSIRQKTMPRSSRSVRRRRRASGCACATAAGKTRTRRASSIPMDSSGTAGAGTPSGTVTCAATCARSGSTAWSTCTHCPRASGGRRVSMPWRTCRAPWRCCRARMRSRCCCTPTSNARGARLRRYRRIHARARRRAAVGQADDLDWFARELSRLSFDFSVLAPAALRAAVKRQRRGCSAGGNSFPNVKASQWAAAAQQVKARDASSSVGAGPAAPTKAPGRDPSSRTTRAGAASRRRGRCDRRTPAATPRPPHGQVDDEVSPIGAAPWHPDRPAAAIRNRPNCRDALMRSRAPTKSASCGESSGARRRATSLCQLAGSHGSLRRRQALL